MNAQTATPKKYALTNIAFSVGELNRDDLEEFAADFGVEFYEHTPSDELRAEVLEALEVQGLPHIKVQYSNSFWGEGEPDPQSVLTTYIEQGVVDAFDGDIDLAFTDRTKFDAVHIIETMPDQFFTANGSEFVGLELLEVD